MDNQFIATRSAINPRWLSVAFILAVAFMFAGCVSAPPGDAVQHKEYKSYVLDHVAIANLGDPILIDEDALIETRTTWVGTLNSADGWRNDTRYRRDSMRKELLYMGREEDSISIVYREFRGDPAAPAYVQPLKFNLSEASEIRFQKYVISVVKADNRSIVYKVVSDSASVAPP